MFLFLEFYQVIYKLVHVRALNEKQYLTKRTKSSIRKNK